MAPVTGLALSPDMRFLFSSSLVRARPRAPVTQEHGPQPRPLPCAQDGSVCSLDVGLEVEQAEELDEAAKLREEVGATCLSPTPPSDQAHCVLLPSLGGPDASQPPKAAQRLQRQARPRGAPRVRSRSCCRLSPVSWTRLPQTESEQAETGGSSASGAGRPSGRGEGQRTPLRPFPPPTPGHTHGGRGISRAVRAASCAFLSSAARAHTPWTQPVYFARQAALREQAEHMGGGDGAGTTRQRRGRQQGRGGKHLLATSGRVVGTSSAANGTVLPIVCMPRQVAGAPDDDVCLVRRCFLLPVSRSLSGFFPLRRSAQVGDAGDAPAGG